MAQFIMTPHADSVHAEKYRLPGETFEGSINRVVAALADNEEHRRRIKDIMLSMRFMPAGRIQAQAGSTKNVTAMNCAVSGNIRDSFTAGQGNIMQRASEAATTMRMGCGIGYDFSTIRPNGSWIGGISAQASGPLSFMDIYDAVCKATASSGNRRGAQMGVLRIDHPDIEAFILAKQTPGRLTGFNVSVGVTDAFMSALQEEDDSFDLRFEGKTVRTVSARNLWELLMRSTWEHAEPGVLFLDTINRENNLWYAEEIKATNPCGEQPLPPYGTCLLGSFNLTRYICGQGSVFNWGGLEADIAPIVRMMDNVIEQTPYPLAEQRDEALAKRRMGLGITGAANAGEALGYAYGSLEFCQWLGLVMKTLRNFAYDASIELAREKGMFPAFDKDKYLAGEFVGRLPGDLTERIRASGIRNSHLISIAPTGTISLTANNVSSGVEPTFAIKTRRIQQRFDGVDEFELLDYGHATWGTKPRVASECTIADHLAVIAECVPFVDSAISKTCVVPVSMEWEEFKDVYIKAWRIGAKGLTTYTDGGARTGILTAVEQPAPIACEFNPETGERSCE